MNATVVREHSWQVSFCPVEILEEDGKLTRCQRRNNNEPTLHQSVNEQGIRNSVGYVCTQLHTWTVAWQEPEIRP